MSDEEPSTSSIYIGVAISIAGNLMISFALNIQKYTHNKNEKAEKHVPYLKRPLWWAGMLLMLGGECGNFLAYAFAPASVVAPLGTVALVSNAIIAPFALKEKFRVQDLFGIVLAIGGAIVIVIFSAAENVVFTVEQLIEALKATKFVVYMCVSIFLLLVLLVISPKFGHKYLFIDMLIVGIFGGYTVISTKAISSLLTHGIFQMFTYWIFYIMLVVLVVTGVLQVKYLQRALTTYDSTAVIPTQFVMFTIFAILGGGILYDDFSRMPLLNILLFLMGILLTFAGVFLISNGRRAPPAAVPESDEFERLESEESSQAQLIIPPSDEHGLQADSKIEEIDDDTLTGKIKGTMDSALNAIINGLENRRTTLVAGMEQIRINYAKDHEFYNLKIRLRPKKKLQTAYQSGTAFENPEQLPPSPSTEHAPRLNEDEDDLEAGFARPPRRHSKNGYEPLGE